MIADGFFLQTYSYVRDKVKWINSVGATGGGGGEANLHQRENPKFLKHLLVLRKT
jgi:hypothetical protein